jgi:hypothetical protein
MVQIKIANKVKAILIVCLFISTNCFISIFILMQSQVCQGSSLWNQTSYNDFDNGTSDNLSIMGKGMNARLEINLSDLLTWQNMEPSNKPIARFGHGMAPIWDTDKVLLFGGQSIPAGSIHLSDTWVYDFSNNSWVQKSPTNKPGVRKNHAMASVWGDDKVVLYGGTSGVDSMNDIWVYDLSDDKWTEKTEGPLGSRDHAMATIDGDDKVLIVAGVYQNGMNYNYLNETWAYDLSDDQWIPKADSPFACWGLGMASIDGTSKYVVFGGVPGNWDNETWLYDYNNDKWTLKTPKNNPGSRYNHGMARIPGTDNALLFGGHGITENNETWVYDLSENNWTKKETNDQPSIRDDLGMSFIYGIDRILLYGGYYYNFPNFYNYDDTWIYRNHLPTKNGTFISSPYDCGYNSSFYELQWYANTPLNTSIQFQLRTGNNESNLDTFDFVGPEGTKNTFYTTTPASIWSGHDGDRWVQYKAYLNLQIFTDSPSINDVTITYNCLPEILATSPDDGRILTNNDPIFNWEFFDIDSDHQKSFQLIIDDDITFGNIDYYSTEQYTTEERWIFPAGTNYTAISDGVWYWKVRAKDADDFWTNFCEPRKLIIDTHSPNSAAIVPVQDGNYNNLTIISGIANDDDNGTGISKVELSIRDINLDKYWNGSTWADKQTWLIATGTVQWILQRTWKYHYLAIIFELIWKCRSPKLLLQKIMSI